MPTFGWRKDPHNPQAVYHIPRVSAVPVSINLLALCPDVRDQGSVGACAAFSVAEQSYTVAKAGGFIYNNIYSPTWLYNGARDLMGMLNQDSGTNFETIYQWIKTYGYLFEKYWPYDPTKLDMSAPGSTRIAEAVKYPSFTNVRVDNGIDGLKTALADGNCVSLGSYWPEEWMAGSTDILPVPTTSSHVAGGHGYLLFGYNDTSGYFDMQNSWGTGWSVGGRSKIPYAAITWMKTVGGYDAEYTMFKASPNPAPQPAPKTGCNLLDLFNKVKSERRRN